MFKEVLTPYTCFFSEKGLVTKCAKEVSFYVKLYLVYTSCYLVVSGVLQLHRRMKTTTGACNKSV